MEFLRKYWYVTSFVVGALSGGVSYISFLWDGSRGFGLNNDFVPYSPGLLFGLASCLFFSLLLKRKILSLKKLLWVLFSTLSFSASYVFISQNMFDQVPKTIMLASMGFIGGLIILFAFNFFITRLILLECLILIIITTLIPEFLAFLDEDLIVLTFFPWQAAVMVVFAHAINRSNQSFVENEVNRIQGVQEQISTPSQAV